MLKTLIITLCLLLLVSPAAGQEENAFSVTLPAEWDPVTISGIEGAADPTTSAVFFAYHAADMQSAITSANDVLRQPAVLTQAPMEVTQLELPSGIWEQQVYIDGDVIALLLVQNTGDGVYVMLVHAPLSEAEGLLPTVQSVLTSFVIGGAVPEQQNLPIEVTYPEISGEYAVGRTEAVWVDDTRDELFTTDPGDTRQVPVTIWFPAQPASAASRAPWLNADLAHAFAEVHGADEQILTHIHVNALEDVPLADSDSLFPVVVMSHGDRTMPALYTTYAETLASSGFMVIGVTHLYNAAIAVLQDGTPVTFSSEASAMPPGISPDMTPLQIAEALDLQGRFAAGIASADLKFVIDQLVTEQALDPMFAGRLDFNRIGVIGHSIGGAAAIETLITDDRVSAAINLDGTVFSDVSTPSDRPVLIVATAYPELEADGSAPVPPGLTADEFEQIAAMTTRVVTMNQTWPEVTFVTIEGAGHNNFSDAGLLAPVLPVLNSDLGPIDAGYALEVSASYAVAFFRDALTGDAWNLAELESRYPESELHLPAD